MNFLPDKYVGSVTTEYGCISGLIIWSNLIFGWLYCSTTLFINNFSGFSSVLVMLFLILSKILPFSIALLYDSSESFLEVILDY